MNILSIGVTSSGSAGDVKLTEGPLPFWDTGGGEEEGSTTGRMIGAMPAVAVRHERRRQEKRQRPSLLYLQSPTSRSPTPSPMHSPPPGGLTPCHRQPPPEIYLCGKVSVLHVVVVSLLLGAVLLIVGLVQLKPGADASQHRYLLLGSGAFMLLLGVVLAIVRCCVLPWATKRHHNAAALEAARAYHGPPPTLESGVSLGTSPAEVDELDEEEEEEADDPSRRPVAPT